MIAGMVFADADRCSENLIRALLGQRGVRSGFSKLPDNLRHSYALGASAAPDLGSLVDPAGRLPVIVCRQVGALAET